MLFLYGNQIEEITTDTFAGLTNLRRLDLGSNKLNNIEDGVFNNLEKLEWFDL